jgi:hypothetical protein
MPRRKEVDAWFAKYDNPMKEVVLRMREIILAADARIDECIKWQAPTFAYEGNLASFFPKSKAHASLMFHSGAKIPGSHPRLVGDAELGRSMKIASVGEADAAKRDIENVVKAWCDWRDSEKAAPTPTARPKAKAKAKAKAKVKVKTKVRRRPAADV